MYSVSIIHIFCIHNGKSKIPLSKRRRKSKNEIITTNGLFFFRIGAIACFCASDRIDSGIEVGSKTAEVTLDNVINFANNTASVG